MVNEGNTPTHICLINFDSFPLQQLTEQPHSTMRRASLIPEQRGRRMSIQRPGGTGRTNMGADRHDRTRETPETREPVRERRDGEPSQGGRRTDSGSEDRNRV